MSRARLAIKAAVKEGQTAILNNQTAWFMQEINQAGSIGLTKADYPGLHVGDLVMRIRRKLGDDVILTEMEPNKHAWGGEHGRYRLSAEITLTKIDKALKQRASQGQAGRSSNINSHSDYAGGYDG